MSADKEQAILKEEYRAVIPARVSHLHELIEAVVLALAEERAVDWAALEKALLRFSGASETYGFPHLATLARYLAGLLADARLQGAARAEAAGFLNRWYPKFATTAQLSCQRDLEASASDVVIESLQKNLELSNANPARRG